MRIRATRQGYCTVCGKYALRAKAFWRTAGFESGIDAAVTAWEAKPARHAACEPTQAPLAMTDIEVQSRFWAKVEKGEDCWIWTAGTFRGGYGQFPFGGRSWQAHRFAYTSLVGDIPAGLQLDHLCRRPSCVNPKHLEPVTHQENVLRGVSMPADCARRTHCPQGHPYDAENTTLRSRGSRECRECNRERRRRRYAENRAEERERARLRYRSQRGATQ